MLRRSGPASLGLETVLVEGDRLGGTCLIRGCIPSKAMIHVAGRIRDDDARRREAAPRHLAQDASQPLDMAETVRWKETVVDKLNGGVAALLKRAKVRVVNGWAKFSDAKTCVVATAKASPSPSPPSM